MTTQVPAFYARVGETFSVSGILRGKNNVPADNTNASSVTLSLWPLGSLTPVYDDVACTFARDATGAFSFDSSSVINFPADDYDMEVRVTYAGSKVKKFPDDDSIVLVRISPTSP